MTAPFPIDRRRVGPVLAALLPGALLALWTVAAFALWLATLEPAERAAVTPLLADRAAVLVLAWLVAAITLGVLAVKAWQRGIAAPMQLADELQARAASEDDAREIAAPGPPALNAIALAANRLMAQRAALHGEMEQRVAQASRTVAEERSRLAALMSQLPQSVVVCNLDGRILLYNNRARIQFRTLSNAPALADGGELIGLGRSIYAVVERQLVAHALQSIQQRLVRGASHPSAQFVTGTRSGQLLRVQMTPVHGADGETSQTALAGFVLMLDNITREFDEQSQRDSALHSLTEAGRASLGTLQAALEMLAFPDLDAATRERFQAAIHDEVRSMSARLGEHASRSAEASKTRWPLEDMLGADLVAAALRHIEQAHGCRAAADTVDAALWLKVDSFSLLQALSSLAGHLAEDYAVGLVQLRLSRAGTDSARAHLDLVWSGSMLSTETVIGWETAPMRVAGGEHTALTVRDVVERHGGAFWFERERVRHEMFFRFLLPLADEREQLDSALVLRSDSRPEYYDFDLFASSESSHAEDDRPLTDLAYTVFDTETTGLDPSQGDRIIQIGATRIVQGKLRHSESFERLVDPGRPISPASVAIHGITDAMLVGQPGIAQVLPAFHAFAAESVLVAHNAAFDMRFLQIAQAECGVAFDTQPVLDTLLLSAVLHPQQQAHRLEAIAERLGVPVLGRHTALGDAMVTAEVFLKMIPLLAERGIVTLGQARAAAERTYYARLSY